MRLVYVQVLVVIIIINRAGALSEFFSDKVNEMTRHAWKMVFNIGGRDL